MTRSSTRRTRRLLRAAVPLASDKGVTLDGNRDDLSTRGTRVFSWTPGPCCTCDA